MSSVEPHNEYVKSYLASFDQAHHELNSTIGASDDVVIQDWISEGRRLESIDDVLAPTGCTKSEIEQVRSALSGLMPASFEAFLHVMGKMKRHVDLGANCYFPAVLAANDDLQAWQAELARLSPDRFAAGDYEVPANAQPIGHHEGYRFAFVVGDSDDPPLLWLREGSASAATIDDVTFSQRVCDAIAHRATTEIRRLDRIQSRRL